ncbi:MAG TPA: cation diffusion facilitator family transporter [Vicinamibacterales bacterium]|nr:cation diffusion facilitator family transporter [Vicinamibacterales bacterium]
MPSRSLVRFAWLSIAAAIVTMALKAAAYVLTGSVGFMSDAIESLVNLVGAVMALSMLTVASRPADEEHRYGHGKAEYFSSFFEGSLIFAAAVGIGIAAVERLFQPRPLEQIGLGIGVSIAASAVNLAAALVILRAGRRHQSISLEANARHLLTDVWTSAGVIAGIGAVALTGWHVIDPIIALAVAANIVYTGVGIVRSSVSGLMDSALPEADERRVQAVLDGYATDGVQFHALRTRQAGARRFVSVHVLVPGQWTVQRGHHLLERIEADVRQALPGVTVFTHLESLDDPASWDDVTLDREKF